MSSELKDVLQHLEERKEKVDDPEAEHCYDLAYEWLGRGIQAEYLEKDSGNYEF